MTPPIILAADDGIELGEMLEFLHDWTAMHAEALAVALHNFTAGGYTLEELQADLARFAFLLDGDPSRLFPGTVE